MTKTKDTFIRSKDKRNQETGVRIDFIFLISLIILFIAIGYGWRMYHEQQARQTIETKFTSLQDHISRFTVEQ